MRFTYSYSIANDITLAKINIEILHQEIKSLTLSSAEYIGINTMGDLLYITFTEEITSGEKDSLDSIILNHNTSVPVIIKTESFSITPYLQTISETSYREIARRIFPGTNNVGSVVGIDINSHCDPGTTSYDVMIININTNLEIASKNMNNYTSSIISFDSFSNIPEELSEISIICKINKTGKSIKNAYVNDIVFWIDSSQL